MLDAFKSALGFATSVPDATHSEPAQAIPIGVTELKKMELPERMEKLKAWLRENEVMLADRVLSDDDWLSHQALALYPASKGGCLAYGPGCFPGRKVTDPIFILGDTHGDFDTFYAILNWVVGAARNDGIQNPFVYLLGDVIDRNGEGCMLECVLILAILQKALPEEFAEFNGIRLGIVKGDHDVGLLYAEPYAPETRFKAMVSPADYCDWLNRRLDDGKGENATKIGRAWIRLMKECPALVFLEECGTLLSHGGVPRKDLQERMSKGQPYVMQSEPAAVDCEWCRMATAKNKLLNRGSKTSEIGGVEFDAFCKTAFPGPERNGVTTTRVRRFVFGHQHPVKGFEQYTKWYEGYEACCIASFRLDDVFGGPTIPHFCRLDPAHKIEMDGETVDILEKFSVYSMNLIFQREAERKPDENPDSEKAVSETVDMAVPPPTEAPDTGTDHGAPVVVPAAEHVTGVGQTAISDVCKKEEPYGRP